MSLRIGRQWGGAVVAIPLVIVLALTASACLGGGGGGDFLGGPTTTPFFRRSPQATGTPGTTPRPVGTPSGTTTPQATATPGATATPSVAVTPVTPFEITTTDPKGVNIRSSPFLREDNRLGGIGPGDKKKVIGEARGEAVEPGKDLWYALEGGGFVYSGVVEKVAQ